MSKVENVFMSNLDSVFCTVPDVSTFIGNRERERERAPLVAFLPRLQTYTFSP